MLNHYPTRVPPTLDWLHSCHYRKVASHLWWGKLLHMSNLHDDPAALKALQDAIYRDKILRARSMTGEQRLAEVFELSEHQMSMMLAGAMHKLGTTDEKLGWQEVARWMESLDRARDHGSYTTVNPAAA